MFGIKNCIKSLLEGKVIVPLPHKRWTVHLDMNRPVNDHCSCGGQMYFADGSDDVLACSHCGLAYQLVLVIDKDAEEYWDEYRKKQLMEQ